MNTQEIIKFISEAPKKTPVKVFVKGQLDQLQDTEPLETYFGDQAGVAFGDWADVQTFLQANQQLISDYHLEVQARNSAVPLLDTKDVSARIEPGALIRQEVTIGQNAVVMMGAVINIGTQIGSDTMIDMGAVIGGRAQIGARVHVGANAVVAGVIEPASAQPVVIGDDVLIGANAVILEGVQVGAGAVVAAGAIVTEDVSPKNVVGGVPAKVLKRVDEQTTQKIGLEQDLRKL
ncbi:2,3,4,5-tetrahydropyridine-2,6-dicarboxylate N-acetyltransferase [Bombilactobacillus folatiphilus]|uniref:2,3,4,5-tetrahydropyridine-2,6-dicarboxylate N-acetyltransferase n=1 Tax=Bombilactobacillus folatiphilus TaxID=2923362 RepID=A0ABY4P9W7_9LACO|nr:2,3,4,5-tetrahydropyridine-2,6-dicarboxylate N-acetyltransferase [Bombilactobacillus folatiphilus]UQS82520.1 2,3,4,5-tetrahydropyridine-2,6-dicarboxylate N-acetyltransferase [Bombilactobacillus folatiphilus]